MDTSVTNTDNNLKAQTIMAAMESEKIRKDRAFAELYHAERLKEDLVHNIPRMRQNMKEKKCNCNRVINKECNAKKDDVMSRWKARCIALRLFGDKESFGILNSRICLYWSKMLIVERISKDPNRKVFDVDEIIKEMVDIFTEILMTYPVNSAEMSDALKDFVNNFFICVDDSGNPIGYQILAAIMNSITSCQMFAE